MRSSGAGSEPSAAWRARPAASSARCQAALSDSSPTRRSGGATRSRPGVPHSSAGVDVSRRRARVSPGAVTVVTFHPPEPPRAPWVKLALYTNPGEPLAVRHRGACRSGIRPNTDCCESGGDSAHCGQVRRRATSDRSPQQVHHALRTRNPSLAAAAGALVANAHLPRTPHSRTPGTGTAGRYPHPSRRSGLWGLVAGAFVARARLLLSRARARTREAALHRFPIMARGSPRSRPCYARDSVVSASHS
jgi:hypothetical protein